MYDVRPVHHFQAPVDVLLDQYDRRSQPVDFDNRLVEKIDVPL